MADTEGAATTTTSSDPQTKLYINHQDAKDFGQRLLEANGVSPDHASIIANALVAADLRGVDTHGLNRLPSYIARIRQGVLDPKAQPTLSEITPVVAQVDAHNAFGFVAAHMGMSRAIESAKVYGISMVSVKHSNHFGMSAWLVQQALSAGLISLVFTNSSPALPVWGGKEKLMGVSPLACGAPGGEEKDFILDMAPSIAARGKIYKAKRRGEKIPVDWALDKEGKRTDDPAAALEGVMLPMVSKLGRTHAAVSDMSREIGQSDLLMGSRLPSHPAGIAYVAGPLGSLFRS